MKKKELLKEIMGVPKVITPWVNSFTNIIIDVMSEETKHGYEETGEITYKDPTSDENITELVYRTKGITITGKEFMDRLIEKNGYSDMKDFLKSDMFKSLPIWRPVLSFDVTAIPDSLYEKDPPPIQASFGVALDQKMSKIGNVPVFPNVELDFKIVRPIDDISPEFLTELKSTISHELLHVYQKIKQLETGGESHYGKETTLNALANNQFFSKLELEWWSKFLHLVYLHLSFEINARITQLYYSLKEKGVKTKKDFLTELKKSTMWNQMKLLENFNAEEFIKEFELPSESLDDFNRNPLEMLHLFLQQKPSLKDRGIDTSSEENAIKSLIGLWDKILKLGNETIKEKHGIDFNMLPVPDKAKKDPYLFFKFFEKRFHNKAKKWKRKLYRIGSLLIED